ncbi:MAG TPA: G1 family glutamic endopeptidase [Ktedonobacterales bacterium]
MRKVCVALGSVLVLLTMVAPVYSAPAPTHAARAQAGVYHRSNQQPPEGSSVWSGYAITGKAITSVTGTFTLPQLRCAPWDQESDVAFWVGIDGFNTPTVEQTGVDVACGPDGAEYRPWYELFPLPAVFINRPAAAGDHITATVRRTAPHKYALTLHDVTAKWTYTTTQTAQHDGDTTAEWIAERASQRVARFRPVRFEQCSADGHPISAYSTATAITLEGWRALVPSSLNTSGNAFRIVSTRFGMAPMPDFMGWPSSPHWLTAPGPHHLSGRGGGVPPWPWLSWWD